MDAVKLGPFVVPMYAAILLASVLLALAVAEWFRRRRGIDAGPVLWQMMLAGLVAGRLVFVLRHLDLYLGAPLSIIDIRDGGLDNVAAFAAAGIVGAEMSRRARTMRRPLLAAALTGCLAYFGGTAANHFLTPAGAPMPPVEVRRLDGTPMVLGAFAGRPTVVNLWATWCPPCKREMPALQAAQLAHPGIEFIFVNQGESAATVQTFLSRHDIRIANVVLDAGGQVSARTGSSAYPTTLFYDAAGRLQQRHMGELSHATLADRLASLRQAPGAAH